MATLDTKSWINLERVQLLLFDDHAEGASILSQIVGALGVRHSYRCTTLAEAQQIISEREIQLIMVNANLKSSNAYDFIEWLRRADIQPNSYAPTILVTGHTQRSNVERARDCGTNSIVAKPVSPLAVLQRIVWVAKEKRSYVQTDAYVGPDRRFRKDGPPDDMFGRRYNDQPAHVSDEPPISLAGMGASLARRTADQ